VDLDEARAAGFEQYSKFHLPGLPCPSVYGEVDYGEWCRFEQLRFREAGRDAVVVRFGRRIALWVEPLEGGGT
jgi:hypothetical protein